MLKLTTGNGNVESHSSSESFALFRFDCLGLTLFR